MRIRNPGDGSDMGIVSLPQSDNGDNGDLYVSVPFIPIFKFKEEILRSVVSTLTQMAQRPCE